jgi:hypothetical protein
MSDDSSDDEIVRLSSSKRRRPAPVLSDEDASASETDDEPIIKPKSSSRKRKQFVDSDGDEIGTLSETPPEPYRNLAAALKAAVPHSQLTPDEEQVGSEEVLDVTDSADEGDGNEQTQAAKPAVHCSSEEEAEFDAAAADDEREAEFDDVVTPLAANSSSSSSKRRASALKQPHTPAITGRVWGSSSTGTTPSLTASGRPLRAAAASAIKQGAYSSMLGGGLSDDGEDSSADATNGAAGTTAAAAAGADSDNESVDHELEAALRLSAASAVKTKPATAAASKGKAKAKGKGKAAKQSATDTVDLVSVLLIVSDNL